jgi:hypothetical protein
MRNAERGCADIDHSPLCSEQLSSRCYRIVINSHCRQRTYTHTYIRTHQIHTRMRCTVYVHTQTDMYMTYTVHTPYIYHTYTYCIAHMRILSYTYNTHDTYTIRMSNTHMTHMTHTVSARQTHRQGTENTRLTHRKCTKKTQETLRIEIVTLVDPYDQKLKNPVIRPPEKNPAKIFLYGAKYA